MHHRFQVFFGRHGAGRGLGYFGRGFVDGGGMGRHGFGMGRKLSSADLQLLILGLLAEKPSHGYEIIKALDERSKGFYVPSPGMIYPALTYLEEIGYATVATDGNRKRYQLTAAGRQFLAEHRARADALFAQFGRVGERMERVRRALGAEDCAEAPRDAAAPLAAGQRGCAAQLRAAGRELQLALLEKGRAAREEQLRVAEILNRATAEILGKQSRG